MLILSHVSLATVFDLFRYKEKRFKLEKFPGYTDNQWGIKAHNRPWVEEVGQFAKGQKIIEVGGAYSLLPKYLAEKYDLEAWIGDDFGEMESDNLWSRWGNPHDLPQKNPQIKYVFERFGDFSDNFQNSSFDRIFTVSTLEHIPTDKRLSVLKDMHRCLKPGGMQIHTIDIPTRYLSKILLYSTGDKLAIFRKLSARFYSDIRTWIDLFESSGVKISTNIPNSIHLLDRQILVESPDVVYRFYPPINSNKQYRPAASLLILIEAIK